jgi:hypothetical protein
MNKLLYCMVVSGLLVGISASAQAMGPTPGGVLGRLGECKAKAEALRIAKEALAACEGVAGNMYRGQPGYKCEAQLRVWMLAQGDYNSTCTRGNPLLPRSGIETSLDAGVLIDLR